MKVPALALALAAMLSAPAAAQDAARGARIYADTARLTGKPVASCAACHASVRSMREMITNRGGHPEGDVNALARWLGAVFEGAQPGAANAKAQYRSVLTATDLRDLAAYIARAKQAALRGREMADAAAR